jgi:hypothetical protein
MEKLLKKYSNSFDETALIYKQAHLGDGPTILSYVSYISIDTHHS